MSDLLKRCPFCKCKPQEEPQRQEFEHTTVRFVLCRSCGARGPTMSTPRNATPEETATCRHIARAEWNRRGAKGRARG